jgi:hypothetical protein
MKIKNKKKNLKPIEYSVNLIYRCPSCALEHWLSLQETKTKGFKTVCDCGTIFRVKLVKDIKLVYHTNKTKITENPVIVTEQQKEPEPIKEEIKTEPPKPKISNTLLDKCCKILSGYGFTKLEAEDLVAKTFENNPTNDCSLLIKNTLLHIGDNKNG